MLKLVITLLIISTTVSSAQEVGKYFLHNYNRQDYQASISNFDLLQDDNGLIYVANYNGILIYNGPRWKYTPLGKKSIVNCIAKDNKNRIFVGSKEDFGFLKPDKNGQLHFISLLSQLPKGADFTSIRKIVSHDKKVYFLSTEAIFILDEKEDLTTISANGFPFKLSMFEVNGKLYCLQQGIGLVSINDTTLSPIDTRTSNWRFVTYMHMLSSDSTLIGSLYNGLHIYSNKAVNKVENNLSQYLSGNNLSSGLNMQIGDSSFIFFGTLKSGIIKTNLALQSLDNINKNVGLQSNIVKGLAKDAHNGLWTAMQEGISRIEVESPWRFWNEESGLEGVPWSIIRHDGILYVGTTVGLFYLDGSKFIKVHGVNNKVWSLCALKIKKSSGPILLAGTEKGLYEISNYNGNIISSFSGIYKLYTSKSKPYELQAGYWGGIKNITYDGTGYNSTSVLSVYNNMIHNMARDTLNTLWVSSKFTGVYRITDSSDTSSVKFYNEDSGLSDVNKVNIIEHSGNILFTTDSGFYRFEESTERFVRDSSLLSIPIDIGSIEQTENGDYFASVTDENRAEHIERFHKLGDEYVRETTPFKRLPEMEILAIYPEDNGIVWIAGSEGLFRYDSKVKKDYTLPFNTVISKASVRDSIIFHGFYPATVEGSDIPGIGIIQPEDMQPTLTYDDNSVTFEYAATSYEVPEKNQFSYYLENNDRGWSNWSTETKKEYNNLDPGEYTFFVKSKNIYGTEGRLATYKFKVLPPWYQTAWAYVIWSVLAGFVVWFITIAYSVRVRTQRKKLQLIVADRTYEVMTQKKEIEQQNHLLKAKNEEISFQKDDIQKKNSQLKESQEEILSMNQKLTELNMYLEKKVEKRTSKIKATLKQLQQINGELDTFVYRASHDLKGPISRINGITSLAKLESPDDINLKYFDMIEHTAKDMEVLLSKLAQVHEIINCKPRKEEIDIPSLLSEIRDMIKFLDKGLKTKYSFDLNQINITSDRYLLSIIIKNLIENALIFRKSASAESHHIHISTNTGEGLFEIKIKDNGIGIHTPHLNMIFQMFFRGSDKSKGSGLGLYLVKMCIDKLKASIEVESKENEFTEFTITIPL